MPAKFLLAPQEKLLYASGASSVINIFSDFLERFREPFLLYLEGKSEMGVEG